MRSTFPLFQSHLDVAHTYWKQLIHSGDTIIDCTAGNGKDALFLAQIALTETSGTLYAIDIQKQALNNTEGLLKKYLSPLAFSRIHLIHGSHAQLIHLAPPHSVRLLVYNLGYLPGGNKSQTTQTESTLHSLNQALTLVHQGGAISITCYPGHQEGACEENAIHAWCGQLNPQEWSCCQHLWVNRQLAPILYLIQRHQS